MRSCSPQGFLRSAAPTAPTRIGGLGVGSFLILSGGILFLLTNTVGAALLKNPCGLQLLTTAIYGALVAFLVNAKKRSPWEVPDEAVSDVDNLALIRIFVGTTIAIGCGLGLFAVFQFDWLTPVEAKAIESERDRRWNG